MGTEKKRGRKLRVLGIILLGLILMVGFLYHQNNSISVTMIEVDLKDVPKEFEGSRILHLSDLHSKTFSKHQKNILKKIEKLKPDGITITGDLVDSRYYDGISAVELAAGAAQIAPVYFVTGNHEWWSGRYESLRPQLEKAGVRVLENQIMPLLVNGQTIYMAGLDDDARYLADSSESTGLLEKWGKDIRGLDENSLVILLAHRPEKIGQYSQWPVDLVLSGHAHGGQFRIPFLGGVVAPDQGFFPKYTSGLYSYRQTKMAVSRGLGNSIIPLRIFNRPEIVLITIRGEGAELDE